MLCCVVPESYTKIPIDNCYPARSCLGSRSLRVTYSKNPRKTVINDSYGLPILSPLCQAAALPPPKKNHGLSGSSGKAVLLLPPCWERAPLPTVKEATPSGGRNGLGRKESPRKLSQNANINKEHLSSSGGGENIYSLKNSILPCQSASVL